MINTLFRLLAVCCSFTVKIGHRVPEREFIVAGYFDGKTMLFGEGIVRGTVTAPRGDNGFGFDSTVIPEGESRTVAEMTTEEKNQISHRAQAMRKLFATISDHVSKRQ